MAEIKKVVCDRCGKEVADIYLESGWITLSGSLKRSWGTRNPSGSAQSDYLDKKSDFCSMECLIDELDHIRAERGGPIQSARSPTPVASRPDQPATAWDRLAEPEDP